MWATLSGVSEPVGALFGYLVLGGDVSNVAYGSMFGIVAGMMVYISLAELLPSAYRFEKNPAVVTASMVSVFFILWPADSPLLLTLCYRACTSLSSCAIIEGGRDPGIVVRVRWVGGKGGGRVGGTGVVRQVVGLCCVAPCWRGASPWCGRVQLRLALMPPRGLWMGVQVSGMVIMALSLIAFQV